MKKMVVQLRCRAYFRGEYFIDDEVKRLVDDMAACLAEAQLEGLYELSSYLNSEHGRYYRRALAKSAYQALIRRQRESKKG